MVKGFCSTCTKCEREIPILDFGALVKPKKNGKAHVSSRCKACANERQRRYKQKHPERIKEREKRAYRDNPERAKARQKRYRHKHRNSIKARQKRYYQNNLEREKARKKRYYQNNLEREKARKKLYRQKHPEIDKKIQKRYYRKHIEHAKERQRRYYRDHPERDKERQERRRARKANAAVNDFTSEQWSAIKKFYGYRCYYCNNKPKILTKDHIIPLSSGGDHTYTNIVPACRSCNSSKKAGSPPIPVQPLLLLAA